MSIHWQTSAEAVRGVRRLHDIGHRSLKAHPGRHADADAAKEALDFQITPYLLRKVRAFADPKRGYTAEKLEDLCSSIHSCWDAFAHNHASFGQTHVLRLASVPKGKQDRAALQKEMFKYGWSTAELESKIFPRYGRRGQGGRKGAIGTNVDEILVRLDRLCTSWLRFHDQLAAREELGETPAFAELPGTVQTLVKSITNKLRTLGTALDAGK